MPKTFVISDTHLHHENILNFRDGKTGERIRPQFLDVDEMDEFILDSWNSVVQPGDNCTRVSILMLVPLETLRSLNNLDANCTLQDNQELLITVVNPVTATPTPINPLLLTPTVTPTPGFAEVCIILYNDLNGDAKRQEKEDANGTVPLGTEPALGGGAVSLTNVNGNYSQTQTTVGGLDPVCFKQVPEGDYNASAAVPENYNPTTALSNSFSVKAGDKIFIRQRL